MDTNVLGGSNIHSSIQSIHPFHSSYQASKWMNVYIYEHKQNKGTQRFWEKLSVQVNCCCTLKIIYLIDLAGHPIHGLPIYNPKVYLTTLGTFLFNAFDNHANSVIHNIRR